MVSAHIVNKRVTDKPIEITNPNGTVMYSTHEAELNLPQLPPAARHVRIVPSLSTHDSLLSMGQLCDAGCKITFTATTVHVRLNSTRSRCVIVSLPLDGEFLTFEWRQYCDFTKKYVMRHMYRGHKDICVA